jgi:hypothetical protein
MLKLLYVLLRFELFTHEFSHKLICCVPNKCEYLTMQVVLHVMLCCWTNIYQRFEEPHCLQNVGNYAAKDVLSHPRIFKSLAETPL